MKAIRYILVMMMLTALFTGGCSRKEPEPEASPVTPPALPAVTEETQVDLKPVTPTPDTRMETKPLGLWLPMRDMTMKESKAVNYEVYTGDVPLALSFFRAYMSAALRTEGTIPIPETLELLEVDIDDSESKDGVGRKWVLSFSEELDTMPVAERDLFLLSLARTIIEGNPYRDPVVPNFTGVRVISGEVEIPVDYEFWL